MLLRKEVAVVGGGLETWTWAGLPDFKTWLSLHAHGGAEVSQTSSKRVLTANQHLKPWLVV